MFKIRKINPMVRAIGTMSAVVAVAGGVTFAQLQSPPVQLADNKVTTTANLQISTGNGWYSDVSGFDFNGLVPGGQSSNSHTFYLKNVGPTPVELSVSLPSLPTFVTSPEVVSVNNYDTFLNIMCNAGGVTFNSPDGEASSFANLYYNSKGTMLGSHILAPNAVATCSANVTMNKDAVNGTVTSVTANPFYVSFVGIAS